MLGLFNCVKLRDDDARASVEGKSDGSVVMAGHSVATLSAGLIRIWTPGVLPDKRDGAAFAHEHSFVDHLQLLAGLAGDAIPSKLTVVIVSTLQDVCSQSIQTTS